MKKLRIMVIFYFFPTPIEITLPFDDYNSERTKKKKKKNKKKNKNIFFFYLINKLKKILNVDPLSISLYLNNAPLQMDVNYEYYRYDEGIIIARVMYSFQEALKKKKRLLFKKTINVEVLLTRVDLLRLKNIPISLPILHIKEKIKNMCKDPILSQILYLDGTALKNSYRIVDLIQPPKPLVIEKKEKRASTKTQEKTGKEQEQEQEQENKQRQKEMFKKNEQVLSKKFETVKFFHLLYVQRDTSQILTFEQIPPKSAFIKSEKNVIEIPLHKGGMRKMGITVLKCCTSTQRNCKLGGILIGLPLHMDGYYSKRPHAHLMTNCKECNKPLESIGFAFYNCWIKFTAKKSVKAELKNTSTDTNTQSMLAKKKKTLKPKKDKKRAAGKRKKKKIIYHSNAMKWQRVENKFLYTFPRINRLLSLFDWFKIQVSLRNPNYSVCCLCFNLFKRFHNSVEFTCNHRFHQECYKKSKFKDKCLICYKPLIQDFDGLLKDSKPEKNNLIIDQKNKFFFTYRLFSKSNFSSII
ncbi:stress response protein nst1 [Anaeramoeba flamelloides]|uniref:Stress response protein nst1 n=1 Tax=Anaeramoeba flamelloides TaxID=1746091 RepID=A0AAV8A5I3_9EUKA|nr:stress response protein nst1 [Anaeramoeba flamelloides]